MNFCEVIFMVLLFSITSATLCDEQSFTYNKAGRKFSSSKHGDYFIQSLMSITSGEPCTHITTSGLLRLHAVKFAIKTRKKFTNKNITVGYQIDDTCLSLPVTMSRGIELTNEQQQRTCVKDNVDTCQAGNLNQNKKLLAVVGAYYSFTTVPLASLLGVYSIPQLTFGASTPLLSKRTDFPSSFRTIPSDEFAVEAMLSVIKHFNWTYIFAVGSDDDYGKLGLSHMKKRANEEGICITGDLYIPFVTKQTESVAKEIAQKLQQENRAKAVVMFNYALGMGEYILEEADKLGLERIWLTSEAWNPEVLTSTRIPKRQLSSIITLSLSFGHPLQSFVNYIHDVVKTEYKCDIWLHEFIKQQYDCAIQSRINDILHGIETATNNSKTCTVKTIDVSNAILKDNPAQVNTLITAVDSVIYAVDMVTSSRCPNSTSCSEISPKDVTTALQNVSFTCRQGHLFSYNENGNPSVVSYSIEQIQMDNMTNDYDYKILGNWTSEDVVKFTLNVSKFVGPHWSSDELPVSTCSNDCQPGQKRVGLQGCCWECEQCSENTITNQTNQDECIPCPVGHHTVTKTSCVETPIIYLGPDHPIGIVTITLSVIGVTLDVICILLIVMYRETQTIKEWSRLFITTSITLLFVTFAYTFIHVVRPTSISCRVQHILFYLILTLYSVTLLSKDASLARFVSKVISNEKNERNSKILIFSFTVVVEIALIIAWQSEEDFMVDKIFGNFKYLERCELKFTVLHIACFAYPSFIVVISLIQTLSERHALNQNRDLKYLHYTCLAFCIINLTYIVTVNHVVGIYKAMVTLCTTLAYGYVYIGCIISTKIFYAILQSRESSVNGICNIGFQGDSSAVNIPKSPGHTKSVTLTRYNANEI